MRHISKPPNSNQHSRKKERGRLIGRTKGGMNTKPHAVCDSQGCPIDLFVTAGQVSDYIGARVAQAPAKRQMAAREARLRRSLAPRSIAGQGAIRLYPGRMQRKTPVKYDKRRCKRRNRIEIMFGRLKDWRRVATGNDRCPKVFLASIAFAALAIYLFSILTLVERVFRQGLSPL